MAIDPRPFCRGICLRIHAVIARLGCDVMAAPVPWGLPGNTKKNLGFLYVHPLKYGSLSSRICSSPQI